MSRNNLEHFVTLLDQYKQVAFPNHVDQELKTAAVLDLFETVDYVKSVPDQVMNLSALKLTICSNQGSLLLIASH